eukprot:6132759-Amphidinium_carterae.1
MGTRAETVPVMPALSELCDRGAMGSRSRKGPLVWALSELCCYQLNYYFFELEVDRLSQMVHNHCAQLSPDELPDVRQICTAWNAAKSAVPVAEGMEVTWELKCYYISTYDAALQAADKGFLLVELRDSIPAFGKLSEDSNIV